MKRILSKDGSKVLSTVKEMSDIEAEGYRPDQFRGATGGRYEPPADGSNPVVPEIRAADGTVISHDPHQRDFTPEPSFDPDAPITSTLDYRLDFSQIVEPVVQYVLYNPGNDIVRQNYNSFEYVLPPHNKSFYKGLGPGECPILDGKEMLDDKSGKRKFQPIPARYIVHFLVGTDGRSGALGSRGVRVLFRDPVKDEAVKAEAKRVHLKHQYELARYVRAAHELRVKNEQRDGVPVTAPGEVVRKAYQFIQWYEKDHGGGEGVASPFPCPKCGLDNQTRNERNAHIEAFHKEYAAEIGITGDGQASPEETIERTRAANAQMEAAGRRKKSKKKTAEAVNAQA